MSLPISAVIIVRNGEAHLARTLVSLADCAEIVVLDSGSTDNTVEIASAAGARVEHQSFLGFGPQKNRAVSLAAHHWILSVDADEELDPTARAALANLDLSDPVRCWRIRRRTFIGARELRHGHLNDAPLRLFNRTITRFNDVPVHESVFPSGPQATLDGSILHYAFHDIADLFARGAGYARTKAEQYRAVGRHASPPTLLAHGAAAFVRSYVLRLGALDGAMGVAVALSAAANAVVPMAMADGND